MSSPSPILSPDQLPAPEMILRRSKSIALLDAILCPEWEYRTYSFNSKWGPTDQMASMRNGSGDEYFILFSAVGVAIKGLAHESAIAAEGSFSAQIQKDVPSEFASFLHEPAFSMDWASFCYWRGARNTHWSRVKSADPVLAESDDGSAEFLWAIVGAPEDYHEWAENMYEHEIPLAAIHQVFAHAPLTEALIKSLNPDADFAFVLKEAAEIGYPGKADV